MSIIVQADSGSMAAAIAQRMKQGRSLEPDSTTILDLSGDYGLGVLPEHVIRAVEQSLDEGETHYTTRPGLPALAEAVAQKLVSEQALTLDPATEVVISCGGREGMFVALQVLVQPGDEVLVPALRPAFVDEDIRLAQGVLVPVPLLAEEGFEMRAERIRERLTDKARVLVLCNPADPTGAVISPEEMARIAALAHEADLTVISDESLDESLDGDIRHTSIASFPEAAQRTLAVGSFSRLHNLASWRVGYFAGHKSLAQPVRDLKQAMTICTSAMSQYAALAALTGPQDWLRQRRAELDAKRAFVLDALGEMGLPHSHPAATPYIFVDVRCQGHTSEDFAAWLLSEAQVAVIPGSRFGRQGEGYVRLSLWPTFSELERAMRRLKPVLDQTAGGAR